LFEYVINYVNLISFDLDSFKVGIDLSGK